MKTTKIPMPEDLTEDEKRVYEIERAKEEVRLGIIALSRLSGQRVAADFVDDMFAAYLLAV